MTDTSALENLKYAHAIDVPLDLSSQEVHELWAEIETMKKRLAYLEAERIVEWVFEDQLPDGIPDAVYSAMYACSKVDFVRVFPAVTVDGRKRFLIELPGA